MHNSTNGTIVTLRAGGYTALLGSVGAGLLSLERKGVPLVHGVPEDRIPVAFEGKTLAPWPNRIRAGKYAFDGEEHQLPINEVETGSALHGLVSWQDCRVVDQSETSASFVTDIAPQPGYPFALRMEVRYTLDPDAGLVCIIAAKNTGDRTAPYGASTHPYLTCGGAPLDQCMLLLPASRIVEVDEDLLPKTTVSVQGTNADFRTARFLEQIQIDNAFTELPPQEWNVDLTHPESNMTVRLTSDEKWVQIYTGEKLGRRAVAVEPMTCPPDAFNSGVDVIRLEPGDYTSLTFSIRQV